MKSNRKIVLTLICFFIIVFTIPVNAATNLKVHFIDVGQGDSILLQYGSSNVLIDTGIEKEFDNLSTYLKQIGVNKISSLIITHPDSDHMGGADLVMEKYSVKTIYMTKQTNKSNEYKEMMAAIKNCSVKRINVKAGSIIPVGKLKASVLAASDNAEDTNSSSIVMKLVHNKKSFLFTGDAPAKVENQVMSNYDVNVDVLKVAHHGSDYSSPIAYLKEASPEYAIISVGENNSYGHPSKIILNRLNKYSDNVYRTNQNGTIVITTTGTRLSCKISKTASNTDDSTVSTEGKIIGNINSKKYHNHDCSSLPNEENRIYFGSDEEAEAAGYEPCSLCH